MDENNEQRVWLETIINKHINNKLVAKILSIDLKRAVPDGENYASIITQATLTVILQNGQKSKLSLIMKNAHENKEKRKIMEEVPAFKVETKVYKQVFKKCALLMDEYEDHNEKLWGNLIGYRPYDLIVFEDLKLQNYKIADRKKMLDLNHSKLVLHSLARLHALCYVLIQKGQLNKGDLPPFYCEIDSFIVENCLKGSLIVLSRVMKKYWSSEWKEIAEKIYNQQYVVSEKLKKLFDPQDNSFITMCHGDCWTSNIMFKYSPYDESYPVSLKFLDLQMSHINSYIYDILYFIHVSVRPDVRRSHYDQLLSLYQKTLKSSLAMYGFEDRAPTLEHVHAEVERNQYYAFTACLIALPITITDVKDGFLMEHLNVGCDPTKAFHEELFNSDLFKSAIQTDIIEWFKKGFFS